MGLIVRSNAEVYSIQPIGHVVKTAGKVTLDILPQYKDALLGLKDFSHIYVLYWFNRNDSPEKRSILKVHPRGNKENPLTGVFATHSPFRPNLIGLSICKIKSIDGNVITVDDIDAFDGTPIIDIKPYRPIYDCVPGASVPDWVKQIHKDKQH
jgi:tRNA-Thr(GGU) m(6)t(6)A37 methyltransferase TsaA